jgi:hypothetical protein
MVKDITKSLENILNVNTRFEGSKIDEYEKAIHEFKKLVKTGVVKQRGYNLMSIEKTLKKEFSYSTNL